MSWTKQTDTCEVSMERRYMIPEWDGSAFQQWAKNYCARNQWRVQASLGDYQDCLAECALIWVTTCQRYGGTVDNAAWMMRMYQICVITTFDTLSVKDSNSKKLYEALPKDEPAIESEALLAAKLSTASAELKEVLKVLMEAPQEILETLRADTSSCHPKQFLKAVVGCCGISKSKTADLAQELQKLLGR